jgi:hypothetical protein
VAKSSHRETNSSSYQDHVATLPTESVAMSALPRNIASWNWPPALFS